MKCSSVAILGATDPDKVPFLVNKMPKGLWVNCGRRPWLSSVGFVWGRETSVPRAKTWENKVSRNSDGLERVDLVAQLANDSTDRPVHSGDNKWSPLDSGRIWTNLRLVEEDHRWILDQYHRYDYVLICQSDLLHFSQLCCNLTMVICMEALNLGMSTRRTIWGYREE